jgi:TonB family protein
MTAWLNEISAAWLRLFSAAFIQNILFLSVILILLYLLRNRNVRLLKYITLVGLIKLFVQPFLSMKSFNDDFIINLGQLPVVEIFSKNDMAAGAAPSASTILMALWLFIGFALFLSIIYKHYLLKRDLKTALPVNAAKYFNENINPRIKFLKSSKNHSPFVSGFFKYNIVVPKDWDKWDSDSQKAILIHELNHIHEGDHWLNLLNITAIAFNFYNPLVWLLVRRLNSYSEIICDEAAISDNRLERAGYTKHLLRIAEITNSSHDLITTLAFSKTHKLMKNRITYLLTKKEGSFMNKLNFKNVLLLAALLLAIIPFSWQCSSSNPVRIDNQAYPAKTEAREISTESRNNDVMKFDEVEKKPEILNSECPEYPNSAHKAGVEGTVVVTIVINEKGEVEEANILKSVPGLDEAALQAAKKCKFKPARYNGEAVKVSMRIPFKFSLK